MSTRKYLRRKVRNMAERRHWKASRAVHDWRTILGVYPGFVGEKRQKKNSRQPILKYKLVRKGIFDR